MVPLDDGYPVVIVFAVVGAAYSHLPRRNVLRKTPDPSESHESDVSMKYYDEEQMGRIRKALEDEILQWSDVTPKEMMGCLCYFRGRKFFAFLVTRGIVITKLPEDARAKLLKQVGGEAFEMAGKKVKTWVRVPLKKREDIRQILSFVKKSYEVASGT